MLGLFQLMEKQEPKSAVWSSQAVSELLSPQLRRQDFFKVMCRELAIAIFQCFKKVATSTT